MSRRRVARPKPDMAWVTGSVNLTETSDSEGSFAHVYGMVSFDDLDEDSTGRVTQDKSDWFVKRCLINVSAMCNLDGLLVEDTARWLECAVGVMDARNANDINTEEPRILDEYTYGKWKRLFQTWVMPTYHPPVAHWATSTSISPEAGDLVVVSTAVGAEVVGYAPRCDFWGPAYRSLDFSVSNAGLRDGDFIYFVATAGEGPGGFNWKDTDASTVALSYQILLQKRMGG